jgi:hypothetical protein
MYKVQFPNDSEWYKLSSDLFKPLLQHLYKLISKYVYYISVL